METDPARTVTQSSPQSPDDAPKLADGPTLCYPLMQTRWVQAPPGAQKPTPQSVPTLFEHHHRTVFENGLLRIMRVIIAPGDSTKWHKHRFDIIAIGMNDDEIEIATRGHERAIVGFIQKDALQYANFAKHPATQRVRNVGDRPTNQLAIEIFLPAAKSMPIKNYTKAPQYQCIADNHRMRVWRLRLAPGEATATIWQVAPTLRIILAGGKIIQTRINGLGKEISFARGDYFWFALPKAFSIVNSGDVPIDMMEIEIKVRPWAVLLASAVKTVIRAVKKVLPI